MKLTHLSIQNVTGVRTPHVPTNTERMQAYRACMPVQFGNAVFTDRYAFDAAPGDDYEDDLREGFALKYGAGA